MSVRASPALFFFGALGVPALALAQQALPESTGISFSGVDWPGAIFDLALVTAVYVALFKAFSRWPRHERWLVGASLLLLPLAATYALWPFLSLSPVRLSTSHPVRDAGLYWSAVAALLAMLWWLLKTRTPWLGPPQPVARRPSTAGAHDAGTNRQARRSQPDAQPAATATGSSPDDPPAARTGAEPAKRPPAAAPPGSSGPVQPAVGAVSQDVFISYRREDSADITGRIYDRLVQSFGRERVFKDVDSIPLGVDFREHLNTVVSRCDVVLAIIGPRWLHVTGATGRRLDDTGDFVRIELDAALSRRIPVIPVLVGGASVPAEPDLPAALATLAYRNGLPVRPDPDFHRDMDRLIAGLTTPGARSAPP